MVFIQIQLRDLRVLLQRLLLTMYSVLVIYPFMLTRRGLVSLLLDRDCSNLLTGPALCRLGRIRSLI